MSLIDGDPLYNVKKIGEYCSIKQLFLSSLGMAERFCSRGLIHGDFNEFNILIDRMGNLTVIDFPQCVSSNHPNAQHYFDHDVECLYRYFDKVLKKSRRE
jgi:RIO kinase 2